MKPRNDQDALSAGTPSARPDAIDAWRRNTAPRSITSWLMGDLAPDGGSLAEILVRRSATR
jgi:hypothetical protein